MLEPVASLNVARPARRPHVRPLDGRHIGLLFEKPSLRTRVTFTIGVRELGGDMVEIPADVMPPIASPCTTSRGTSSAGWTRW